MTSQLDSSETERALREGLADRARQIQPASRLDAILREASAPEAGPTRSRWLSVIGVAAASAVVAGTVWASLPDTDSEPTQPGGPAPTSPTSQGPVTTPGPSPSTSQPTTSTDPQTSSVAQAIYRVGTNGGVSNRPGLVREYRTASVGSSETARVSSAVVEALDRTDLWQGVDLAGVEVTRSMITVRLGGPGTGAPDADSARLAAYALAWSAQGAVGRGDLPVSIRSSDGRSLLGRLDSSVTVTRAATPPEDLCDIWIDSPAPGATLSAGSVVVVRGQAVAWEATLDWGLSRDGAVVRTGFATSTEGAPKRGSFTIDLGRLQPGTYTMRAFTTSAEDGATALAERTVTFSVA